MSKAKELQAENNNLKLQLAQVVRDRDYARQQLDSSGRTISSYRTALNSARESHQHQLIQAVEICAKRSAQMLNDQARNAELQIVAAERDAVGEALRYTIDNLTISK